MKYLNESDEKALLLKIRSGDRASFESIYHHYKTPLAKKRYRILKSWDQTQDVFLCV